MGDEKGACYKGGRILINCKVPPTMADFRILDQEHLKRDKNKLQKIREISKVEKKIEESKTPEEKAALKKRLDKLEGKNKNFSSFISGFKEETKESTPLGIVIGVAEKLNPVAALFFATSTPVNTNEEQLLHGIRKPQYSTKDAEYIKNNYPEMYPEIKGSINPKIKEFNKKAVDVSATKFYGKDEENANEFGKFLGSIVGFEAGRGAANTVINTGVKYYSSSSKSLFEKGHSEEIGKNLNDYASSKSNPNKRYTASESEAELTTRLKEMYKDKPNTTIETQESYKGGENVKYGIKGSVRPENSVVENGIVKETYEIKNYNQENYNSMTSNIGKQAIKRAEELPETATQKIVIDTRGQKITPEIRQKITEDIIRKSNKIIKKKI
ncbi:hypothetical protein JCM16774_2112 [Pseudoleptotrichia goodfellowii]|uniref:Uncharacterized protein n=2 Tax=Pseudoleptotrichia goodfellowii TaxID=157692 RepID=A0A510JGU6_9FUSO|nr:hypothetical protein JCM16774_2112 [Pseudoleptotrichia goodfellowii]